MDITPLIPQGRQIITGYGNGQFKISGEVYTTPVLVFPDRTVQWDIVPGTLVTPAHLEVVLEEEGYIDLLIIGTGKKQDVLPQGIRTALKDVGIALEIMDTGAACRTYNILMAEGRRVAAALIAV